MEHPDQASALTPTVRTPECGHTVWRKKVEPPSESHASLMLSYDMGLDWGSGEASYLLSLPEPQTLADVGTQRSAAQW